jgi:hypothetical protein
VRRARLRAPWSHTRLLLVRVCCRESWRAAGSGQRATDRGAGSPTSPGWTATPARVIAVATSSSAATGRQRREGSVPIGNSSSMNATPVTTGTKLHWASSPGGCGRGQGPRMADSPYRVSGAQRHDRQEPAVAEQEPADRVAGAADNQRSETGVHRGCRPRDRAEDRVPDQQVVPRHNGGGRSGQRQPRPARTEWARSDHRRWPGPEAGPWCPRRAPATRAAARLRCQPWARRADAAVASARSSSGAVWAYSVPTRSSSARGPGQGRADI